MSRTRIALVLFLLAVTVYVVPGRDGGTGDTIPAQLLPLSVLGEGDLDFNEFVCPPDPTLGEAGDYAPDRCTAPLPYYFFVADGRVVSSYPIIAGLLNVPTHVVAMALGVDTIAERSTLGMITAALSSSLAVCFLFLFLSTLPLERATAVGVSLTFAFGTLVWGVAGHGLWQHGPSLLFITAALWGIGRGERRSLMWAGLALGFAVFARPTNILLVVPLAWHVARKHQADREPFLALFAVPMLIMTWYSWDMLGSFTALGQGQRMRIGTDPLEGLAGLLVSPARGLLIFTPLLLVALPALPHAWRRQSRFPLLGPLMLGAAAIIGVHALWHVWWGGVTYGYRLLLETLPAFMLLLAVAWETHLRGHPWRVAVAGVLLALSLWTSALGALVAPCGFDMDPVPVDQHPERLWDVRDTEIVRCTARVFGATAARQNISFPISTR